MENVENTSTRNSSIKSQLSPCSSDDTVKLNGIISDCNGVAVNGDKNGICIKDRVQSESKKLDFHFLKVYIITSLCCGEQDPALNLKTTFNVEITMFYTYYFDEKSFCMYSFFMGEISYKKICNSTFQYKL